MSHQTDLPCNRRDFEPWETVWWQYTWAEKWGCCAPFEGELGPHLSQCGLGWGLRPYHVAS